MIHHAGWNRGSDTQEQENLWHLGGQRIIQALETQIQATDTVFEYLVPAGSSVLLYGPYPEDTAIYVVEGEADFYSGPTPAPIAHAMPGTFLFLPRPAGLRYAVPVTNHVRLLSWTTPRGLAQHVTHMGSAGEAFVLAPPSNVAIEKVEQFAARLRRYLGSTHHSARPGA